jgi:hypothetical protein
MIERLAVGLAAVAVGAALGALAKRSAAQLTGHAAHGLPMGLTLFTAPLCSQCEVVRGMLRELPGSAWQEISVMDRPDLVRQLDLRTAPSLVAVDRHGRVVDMIRGSCEQSRIAEALDSTLPPAAPSRGDVEGPTGG